MQECLSDDSTCHERLVDSEDELEYWDVTEEELAMDFEESPICAQEGTATASYSELAIKNLVHLTLLFILLWGCHYGISANALDHLIRYLHHFLASLGPYTPFAIANVLAYFPTTLYLV